MAKTPKLKPLNWHVDLNEETELRTACLDYASKMEQSIKTFERMGYNTYTNLALADMYEAHNQLIKHLPVKEA